MTETKYSSEIEDLKNLSSALSAAVANDFMAREHAKSIWIHFLKSATYLDVPKILQPIKKVEEKKEEVKS
jgi:hypothetical protein